jgi:4-methyl-5(b-hydroxyethyl)-thiazole monophosphate biosynthesis
MARVLIPLAQGCEELEAVTLIDLLRRANIEVVTAGLRSGNVTASRGTVLVPDTTLDAVLDQQFDMLVLPGGLPGSDHLDQDSRIHTLLQKMSSTGKYTAAICAAPKILARAGLLDGKTATCYPGILNKFNKIDVVPAPVVTDGKVITSRGPGTAIDFALTLIELLSDRDNRDIVEEQLQRENF